jgi:hypothetical protein
MNCCANISFCLLDYTAALSWAELPLTSFRVHFKKSLPLILKWLVQDLLLLVAGYGRRKMAVRGVQRRRSAAKFASFWRWT